MTDDELFEFYKGQYEREDEARDDINGRLQIPLAIIVSLIGVLAAMVRLLGYPSSTWKYGTFSLLILASGIYVMRALYFFVRAWRGYEYKFLPTADQTRGYRDELKTTYAQYSNAQQLVDQYTKQYIQNYYISCSTQNTDNNDARALNLHYSNRAIIVAALLVAATYVFHECFKMNELIPSESTSVRIVQPVEIKRAP